MGAEIGTATGRSTQSTPSRTADRTFGGITSEGQVHEVHGYLFRLYVLLGEGISARKLHHKPLFSLEMDYGHEVYPDKLISTRHS
ncbi:hypothetical protein B0I37DRAFT_419158 [Chaetomium sp. MPI-CAGE-AT-0009]|nr:hypothetical protein B0I37DRAFT_419158 [Chaetomium sp. MPI-CAGE-AT-0009]